MPILTGCSRNCGIGLAKASSHCRYRSARKPISRASQCRHAQSLSRHDSGESAVPADLATLLAEERSKLMEVAAESDDKLIEKYLGGEELTDEEMKTGLRQGFRAGSLVPVLLGSSTTNTGVPYMLKFLADYAPSPLDAPAAIAQNPVSHSTETLSPKDGNHLAAFVFKTMADPFVGKLTHFRVYSGRVESDSRVVNSRSGQEERIGQVYVLRGKEQISVKRLNAG